MEVSQDRFIENQEIHENWPQICCLFGEYLVYIYIHIIIVIIVIIIMIIIIISINNNK